jgi:hypothetical protein
LSDKDKRDEVPAHLVAVVKDPTQESPSEVARLSSPGLQTVFSSQAWLDYDIPGSPYFVHVDGPSSRVVGEGSAVSWDQVMTLLSRSAEDREFSLVSAAPRLADPDDEARMMAEFAAAGVDPRNGSGLSEQPDA